MGTTVPAFLHMDGSLYFKISLASVLISNVAQETSPRLSGLK